MLSKDGRQSMTDIEKYVNEARKVIAKIDIDDIAKAAKLCIDSITAGGTVFFCGNGGSAADAQHFAGELVARFRKERKALPAIALNTNTSILTAVANDTGFEKIFSRQLEAHAKPGDVLVAISTSGNSDNVIEAGRYAQEKGLKVIAMTGADGGNLIELADAVIKVKSGKTSHIQEYLLIAGHALCGEIERILS